MARGSASSKPTNASQGAEKHGKAGRSLSSQVTQKIYDNLASMTEFETDVKVLPSTKKTLRETIEQKLLDQLAGKK
eukprot:5695675-Lingulodinium_polyedra.AAC.1